MQLYLIRHTRPAVPAGVCYGQADVDVAETFFDELQVVRGKLAAIHPAASFSSPLSRCARLAASLGLAENQHDHRLTELSFGEWEMRAWDDIPREQLDRWGESYVHLAPPGGETFGELHARVVAFLQERLQLYRGKDVVVVTHAGVIRALLAEALGVPLTEAFRFHLDYGGVTLLRLGDAVPMVGYVNR